MTQFQRLALAVWDARFDGRPWAPCEGGCGRWVERGAVPHHDAEGRGGIGGKRKHVPDYLRYLCDPCHRAAHKQR